MKLSTWSFFFCLFATLLQAQDGLKDRYFAFQIDEAEGQDFEEAFQLGLDACMNATHVFFTWKDLEPTAGAIGGEAFDLLDVVDLFYSLNGISIEFQLGLVNTVTREVPEDLKNVPFDDPVFIDRFKILLDSVFAHLPEVKIAAFNIGNEVDIFFGQDADAYATYKSFFEQVKPYAEQLYMASHGEELQVGVTMTFDGLTNTATASHTASLNEAADLIALTYYPLTDGSVRAPSTVFDDFDRITALYPAKPLYFVECGYPSSSTLNSSDEKQRQFWENIFTAWDEHESQIDWLMVFKLSDWSQETVNTLAQYYGFPDDLPFKEFLRTLGVRTYPNGGEDKPAYSQILCEVTRRNFCDSGYTVGNPDWPAIKANAMPLVNATLADEYERPYLQPLHVGGWEDGLYISRDGLHLYAFYSPLDMLSFVEYVETTFDNCYNFTPYYRGPLLGMDTITNPAGCPSWIHSDIIYATRPDHSTPFTSWTVSNLATPVWYEGAPQVVMKDETTADVFVFTRGNPGTETDLMWMRNVSHNPGDNASPMPASITTAGIEDNPHIERIDASTLVLFFDNDGDAAPSDIWWSISTDDGTSWQAKQKVSSISTEGHDVQPHLWHDGDNWWLYYVKGEPISGGPAIYRAMQQIPGDWDSWGSNELVISAGEIQGDHGQIFGVGEPSLTQWGDLSFVVVYGDLNSCNPADRFDIDPWLLPRKGSPLVTSTFDIEKEEQPVFIFPNPFREEAVLELEARENSNYDLLIFNSLGQSVKSILFTAQDKMVIKREGLENGVYFYQLSKKGTPVAAGRIIIY